MISEAGVTEIRLNHDHDPPHFAHPCTLSCWLSFASKKGEVGQLPGGITGVAQDIILLPFLPCTFDKN